MCVGFESFFLLLNTNKMTNPYHDWQEPFIEYFGENMRNLSIVELGKGEGTLFLHKNFKKVVSVEYGRHPFKTSWETDGLAGHILDEMKPHLNIHALDDILIHSEGRIRPQELAEEAKKIHDFACKYDADVLFIDHGCHNRGEVLEEAKVGPWKYIVIHDSNFPYYGYNMISSSHTTSRYTKGQGTVFFKKNL
jgi:hypothetical protein